MKVFVSILLIFFLAGQPPDKITERDDFKLFFDRYKVKGSFLLSDLKKSEYSAYNYARCKEAFLPASTFKILNSLIGLETGVAPDENFVIPWDGITRENVLWNQNHTMASAFRNSVVPWYQELARRIGPKCMADWVHKVHFGNMDISNKTIDSFWLGGKSRITSLQQMDFLIRFVKKELSFSERTMEIVRKIFIVERNDKYIFSGKTGWTMMDEKNIGWYVGYLEKQDNKYLFVLNVESSENDTTLFQKSREGITREILGYLKLM
jgi:beta-lactamase class D